MPRTTPAVPSGTAAPTVRPRPHPRQQRFFWAAGGALQGPFLQRYSEPCEPIWFAVGSLLEQPPLRRATLVNSKRHSGLHCQRAGDLVRRWFEARAQQKRPCLTISPLHCDENSPSYLQTSVRRRATGKRRRAPSHRRTNTGGFCCRNLPLFHLRVDPDWGDLPPTKQQAVPALRGGKIILVAPSVEGTAAQREIDCPRSTLPGEHPPARTGSGAPVHNCTFTSARQIPSARGCVRVQRTVIRPHTSMSQDLFPTQRASATPTSAHLRRDFCTAPWQNAAQTIRFTRVPVETETVRAALRLPALLRHAAKQPQLSWPALV